MVKASQVTHLILLCFVLFCESHGKEFHGLNRVTRIVGGNEANRHSQKWQALILWKTTKTSGKYEHHCGGALIHPKWIVTAAHCVFQHPELRVYKIVLGEYDRTMDENTEQRFDVADVRIHRRFYTDKGFGYDIAIMKLSRPAILSGAVGLACLPKQGERVPIGTKCRMTGWGKTSITSNKSEILLAAEMPVVSYQDCKKGNSWFQPVDDDSMICAGLGEDSGISGCNGDSGGPFMCNEDGRWVLRGVVSWGDPKCSTGHTWSFSVFARISSFIDWIRKNMNEDQPRPVEPITGDLCEDDHEFCGSWKKMNLCEVPYFKKRLEIYCQKSCGYCTPTENVQN